MDVAKCSGITKMSRDIGTGVNAQKASELWHGSSCDTWIFMVLFYGQYWCLDCWCLHAFYSCLLLFFNRCLFGRKHGMVCPPTRTGSIHAEPKWCALVPACFHSCLAVQCFYFSYKWNCASTVGCKVMWEEYNTCSYVSASRSCKAETLQGFQTMG